MESWSDIVSDVDIGRCSALNHVDIGIYIYIYIYILYFSPLSVPFSYSYQ